MFVAINYISCKEHYKEKFEILFATRAIAIDTMPGFINMHVLKPKDNKDDYLIVNHWEDESNFVEWTKSAQFLEGHRRGFKDITKAKNKGEEPPMKSTFKTYKVIAE